MYGSNQRVVMGDGDSEDSHDNGGSGRDKGKRLGENVVIVDCRDSVRNSESDIHTVRMQQQQTLHPSRQERNLEFFTLLCTPTITMPEPGDHVREYIDRDLIILINARRGWPSDLPDGSIRTQNHRASATTVDATGGCTCTRRRNNNTHNQNRLDNRRHGCITTCAGGTVRLLTSMVCVAMHSGHG